ncbi:hypothetical protein CALCODRAFT_491583 [Calocera cornea HHB12733]|uniref:Uncharacterized protein n=1 Tax=Calocera cornea HHB12733 TaxID=1353952 RepID=A0A165IZK0_9BASI|nr:hypothetical protein CALCODRAFT_491583 [Calocera cornea HHB12733]
MLSDYELMASEPEDGSSPPSSPFSLVSSARTLDPPSDLDFASDDDIGGEDINGLDVHSVSGSERDWGFIQRQVHGSESRTSSVFSSNPEGNSSNVSSSSSRSPSPPLMYPSSAAYTPPHTPRPRSPPLLQLPISDSSAQPFTLVRLLNLPQYQTLDDLVNILTKTASTRFRYTSRIPVPLWISLRPAMCSMEPGDTTRSTALVRFLNPEDAASLAEMFDWMKHQLVQMEEDGESWFWLLDLDVVLCSDEEVEKGEEGKGLLWVAEWLRKDNISGAQPLATIKQAASDLITTILVTPLPAQVRLKDLVDLFVDNAPEDVPKPLRIVLLPDLAAHTIFLPCCVLQYVDAVVADRAMGILSGYETLLLEPYKGSAGGARCFFDITSASAIPKKCKVEFKSGDWWGYTESIRNAEFWPPPKIEPKAEFLGDALDDTWSGRERFVPSSRRIRRFPVSERRASAIPRQRTSVALMGLPDDIFLDEIVKVYTTPPIVSLPAAPMSVAPSNGSPNDLVSSTSGLNASSTATFQDDPPHPTPDELVTSRTTSAPFPTHISILDDHPTFYPQRRVAVITFNSAEDLEVGYCLLPPSMWYRPGSAGHPNGSFVMPSQRNGTEQIFQCEYRHGDWRWLHDNVFTGRTTWWRADGTTDSQSVATI